MSLNENIKYCKKPIHSIFDDIKPPEEKKFMKCISQLSEKCVKQFKTTKESRICSECTYHIYRAGLK